VITLEKPYTVSSYREAIAAFEDAGHDVIIIDSLSHAWSGVGGLLDKQARIAKSSDSKNSYLAWREVTPDHNSLVETMLTSPAHIIATMRVKTEYVLETNDKGKQVPRKIGLQPIQRDGLEYEFTVVMDIDSEHRASASKDRTKLFRDWYDEITERTGKQLRDWLDSGVDVITPMAPKQPDDSGTLAKLCAALDGAPNAERVEELMNSSGVQKLFARLGDDDRQLLSDTWAKAVARTVIPDNQKDDAPIDNFEWPTTEEAA
jgi:hypothetical protein